MDSVLSLQEAIENAKQFQNFQAVFMAVTLHPEWLVEIPENRKWPILYHVVYSGNTDELDRLLALQKMNKNFRLCYETPSRETVFTVAKTRPQNTRMLERIERLIKLDEMLNYAKDCEWDRCYEIVKENPSYKNEKPPYRRFYLIHHIAYAKDSIEQFERFKQIDDFPMDMTLRADRKKINVIAREEGHEEFAEYLEQQYSQFFDDDDDDDQLYEPSEQARQHTEHVHLLMEQRNVFSESNVVWEPAIKKQNRKEIDDEVRKQQEQNKPRSIPRILTEHPIEHIRSLLTCSLTKAIVTDPVVAADGFTYERSAIENWMKKNDYSPMTHEKFAHTNLNPNYVVKQILHSITQK
ncbi:hypothetical protein I4U23_001998 [Adineta vaga]|nr:hypothetical protein I4U23_001998 [Adineta vaga]